MRYCNLLAELLKHILFPEVHRVSLPTVLAPAISIKQPRFHAHPSHSCTSTQLQEFEHRFPALVPQPLRQNIHQIIHVVDICHPTDIHFIHHQYRQRNDHIQVHQEDNYYCSEFLYMIFLIRKGMDPFYYSFSNVLFQTYS